MCSKVIKCIDPANNKLITSHIDSVPTSQRTGNVCNRKTLRLILARYTVAVYCGFHTDGTDEHSSVNFFISTAFCCYTEQYTQQTLSIEDLNFPLAEVPIIRNRITFFECYFNRR